jgi:hypothetical protein
LSSERQGTSWKIQDSAETCRHEKKRKLNGITKGVKTSDKFFFVLRKEKLRIMKINKPIAKNWSLVLSQVWSVSRKIWQQKRQNETDSFEY